MPGTSGPGHATCSLDPWEESAMTGHPRSWRRPSRGTARRSATGGADTVRHWPWCTARRPARWKSVLPLFEPDVAVCAMDRRGHGASGDAPGYSLEEEAADVAHAVLDQTGESDLLRQHGQVTGSHPTRDSPRRS
jgi:pimeloyl-ACP methyl ester carboxylesterase